MPNGLVHEEIGVLSDESDRALTFFSSVVERVTTWETDSTEGNKVDERTCWTEPESEDVAKPMR